MYSNKTMMKLSHKNIKIVYKFNEQRRARIFIKNSFSDYFGSICCMLGKRVKVMNIYILNKQVLSHDCQVKTNKENEKAKNVVCDLHHDNYKLKSEALDFINFFHKNVAGYHLHVCNEIFENYTKVFVIEEIRQGKFYG